MSTAVPVGAVRYVKELYPRLKPIDDVIERYRDALANLPPIVVARDGVLVDGYHRWQAHVREGAETIQADDLGNLSDAEIVRESIRRNATHGQQLSRDDKRRMAGRLWTALADLAAAERVKDIADLLAVSDRSVQDWTKDVRKWRVRHPGIGTLTYGSEREARVAAGTAGEVLPPALQDGQPSDWRTQTCRCGHPGADHDAGECWAIVLGSQCPCSWWEPIPERKTDDDES